MATLRTTSAGAYVELDPEGLRTTSVGAYVELKPKKKRPPGKPPTKPPKPPKPSKRPKFSDPIGSLSAWWPAIMSAGSKVFQDIVSNNDGIMQGTVPWDNDGQFAISAHFDDNSANFFDAGAGRGICDVDMSISAWVAFDDLSTTINAYEIIFARSKAGNDSYVLGVRCYATGAWPRVYWTVNGVDMFAGDGPEIMNGNVYHIVITGTNGRAPGTWDLYINGDWSATSGNLGGIPFNGTDTYLGRREWVGSEGEMDGKIYDLRIYYRPLTPEEVARLHDNLTRWELYRPEWGILGEPLAPFPPVAGGSGLSGLSGLSSLSGLIGAPGGVVPAADALLKEDAEYLLLETDDFILIE